ncbi:MAG: hypothetical protein JXJ17_03435 [Anaerolineae bacterium]|nr:hypothetical protein [Anaerolineae bacterium]
MTQQRQQIIVIATLMALCILFNVFNLIRNGLVFVQSLPSNTLEDYHAEAYPPERFQILLYLDENFRNWRLVAPSEEFVDKELQIFPLMFIEAGGQMGIDYHDYDVLLTDSEAAVLQDYEHVWFENGDDIDIYVVFSDEPETSKRNWLAMYNHSLYIIPQSLVPTRMLE